MSKASRAKLIFSSYFSLLSLGQSGLLYLKCKKVPAEKTDASCDYVRYMSSLSPLENILHLFVENIDRPLIVSTSVMKIKARLIFHKVP